jgi:hypothetical protein
VSHPDRTPLPAPEPGADQLALFDDQPRPGEYPLPAGEAPGTCRSCGAPIVWTVTDAGRRIPLDLATARRCGAQRVALTHFATCPDGRQWRKGV